MLVKRSTKVKMIMTPDTRRALDADYLGELKQIRLELEQLEFQFKKLVADAKKKNLDAQQIGYKIEQERKKRLMRLEQLEVRIKEMLRIEDGVELYHSTVDTFVDIKVGDCWSKMVEQPEIVLQDGIVVEIRDESYEQGDKE